MSEIGSLLSEIGSPHITHFKIIKNIFVPLKNEYMKSTFRILFYLKRDKQRVDGTVPVWCRITVDGQVTRFNTKSSVSPNIWDAKATKAIGKTKDAMEINSLLDTIKASIYKVYHELQTRENNVSAERVKNVFPGSVFLGLASDNFVILYRKFHQSG